MNLSPHEVASNILTQAEYSANHQLYSEAFAPTNIALCKYWGKRNSQLNLPVNDSLSISLGSFGSHTKIFCSSSSSYDAIWLNEAQVDSSSVFYQRIMKHVGLFREYLPRKTINIQTKNNMATSAGLASSASGFAALTQALANLCGFNLSKKSLSILSRLGSGSACRSIFSGFVRWHKGNDEDGMDSYAQPLDIQWPELGIGILTLINQQKKISSRDGMARTVETSQLYNSWPKQAERDIEELETAIRTHNFQKLGQTAECNALAMHATMISSNPPLLYWQSETVSAMQATWKLREQGLPVYFTMDAGPNPKLIFETKHQGIIKKEFPKVKIVQPFNHAMDK